MSNDPLHVQITIRPTWCACRTRLRGDVLRVSLVPLLVTAYWSLAKLRWRHWRGLLGD